jgi:hypothetical protein
MIKPGPPSVFSLPMLMAQAVFPARLGPGTVGRLPVKNPEVMVDDRAIEGQSISAGNPGRWVSLLLGCGRGNAEVPVRILILVEDGLRHIFQKKSVIIKIICRSLPNGV